MPCKKKMLSKILPLLLLLTYACITEHAIAKFDPLEFGEAPLLLRHRFGNLNVKRDDKGFHVVKYTESGEFEEHFVQPCFVDKEIRNLTHTQLGHFLQHGYLSVNSSPDDDTFFIHAHLRGNAGGPFAAVFAGVGTATAVVATCATGNAPMALTLVQNAPLIILAAAAAPGP